MGNTGSSGRPLVRLIGRPLPTWLTQTSDRPAQWARNATNLPSGEMDASLLSLGRSVKRENTAFESGLSTATKSCRRLVSRPAMNANSILAIASTPPRQRLCALRRCHKPRCPEFCTNGLFDVQQGSPRARGHRYPSVHGYRCRRCWAGRRGMRLTRTVWPSIPGAVDSDGTLSA